MHTARLELGYDEDVIKQRINDAPNNEPERREYLEKLEKELTESGNQHHELSTKECIVGNRYFHFASEVREQLKESVEQKTDVESIYRELINHEDPANIQDPEIIMLAKNRLICPRTVEMLTDWKSEFPERKIVVESDGGKPKFVLVPPPWMSIY